MTNPDTTNAEVAERHVRNAMTIGYLRTLQVLLLNSPKTPEREVTLSLADVAIKSLLFRNFVQRSPGGVVDTEGTIGEKAWFDALAKLQQVISETHMKAASGVGVDVDLVF